MITPRVEYVSRQQPAAAQGSPRMYYSFRSRSSGSTEETVELIESRRRDLRHVREGSAEAAEILREIGMLLARSGRVGESLDTYKRSLKSSRKASDHRQSARALEAMGMLHARRGDFDNALECYFDALREGADDPRGDAAAWMEIAAVYAETGMLDLAAESLERSIRLLNGPSSAYLQARARVSAASVYASMDRHAEAIDQALRGVVALEAFDDYAGQVEALLVVGAVYRQLGDRTSARGYLERAAEIARERAHVPGIVSALLGLAELHRDDGNDDRAIAVAEEGVAIARDGGLTDLQWRLHELASELYERAGDAAQALSHLRSFVRSRERSRARLRDERFDELRVRHESHTLAIERDELRRQCEQLRDELADRNRQLTSATLSLVQRSELLDEVREQLSALMHGASEYSTDVMRPILDDITVGSSAGESWQMFEQQFDQVHADFTHRLAERYPTLTPMELKVCTLTRMDLSAKDVGRILHVSERNVQNHRYRLRKKLALTSEENLASFLAGV
jgi:tetratricopeptide (TPR) repeat protein/DNA-binding CsgD family transcriptional regulator